MHLALRVKQRWFVHKVTQNKNSRKIIEGIRIIQMQVLRLDFII